MTQQRTFFDCLDEQRQAAQQAQAMEFEPVGDQSTEVDREAEIAAFVTRPERAAIEAVPVKSAKHSNVSSYSSGASTPLAQAAGLYGTGQR